MKVLYFSPGLSPHDQRFLTALAGTAHEIHFLHETDVNFSAIPINITQHRIHDARAQTKPGDLSPQVQFKNIVKKIQPDLIHAGPLHGSAWIAASSDFKPLISMSWAADILYWFDRDEEIKQKILETLASTRILVGDCLAVADKAVSLGFPRERIHLFPWGVNLEHFQPLGSSSIRKNLGWQENIVFLCNRSFEPIYGVDLVVSGFIEAEKRNPSLRLLFYGKGSMEGELKQMVTSAGVQDKVFFGGYAALNTLPDLYRSADVYLTASHCDGSSVSLMEAMACGKPAIVSDIPGNLEWVEDGIQGWVFRDGDLKELVEKMLTASNSAHLPEMARKARVVAEMRADWKTNFPVLLKAYQSALEIGR